MDNVDLDRLRFPIGKFQFNEFSFTEDLPRYLEELSSFPSELQAVVDKLQSGDLEKPYRPGGWTVKQVIHHLADSHMNAYIRFKLVITEDTPTIKTYNEALWAELPDVNQTPISESLSILKGVHARWTNMLNNFQEADFQRELFHPEQNRNLRLSRMLSLYCWHGKHHIAHIFQAIG